MTRDSLGAAESISHSRMGASARLERMLPPLVALAYPGIIWCGPAVGSIFLAIALGVPLIAILSVQRAGADLRYPHSRQIAFAAVGAPPLYSLIGGLLDFQSAIPFHGLHVWIPAWALLTWIVYAERPRDPATAAKRNDRLAIAHGVSGVLVLSFVVAHLINHLVGFWDGELHLAVMNALRHVYRNPIIETALLVSIGFQIFSGTRLLRRKTASSGNWFDTIQATSAVYLVFFLASHLTAVLRARFLRHVDTNWEWLTGNSLLTDPWSARLTPYYFLGVIAVGCHGAAGLRQIMITHGRSQRLADATFHFVIVVTAILSTLIMVGLIRASVAH